MVIEDNQSTVTGGIVAYQKLVSQNPDLLAIAGLTFSHMVLGLMPHVTEEKTPCIVNAGNKMITQENNGYMFRVYVNDAIASEIVARYAYEKLGKKIALINVSDEFGTNGSRNIADTLEKYYGVKPVLWERYNPGEKDFTAILMKIKNSGADVIINWGQVMEISLFMNQRAALGMTDIPLIGSPDHGIATTMELAKSNANGVYSIVNFIPNSTDPKIQAYVDRFQKKWGVLPDTHTALYDGVYLLKAAIEKVGEKGLEGNIKDVRQRITDALYGMTYEGICTTYYVAPTGDALWELMIVQVEDGEQKRVVPVEYFRTEPAK
jgi:branched-chain amino acid transport system substrate-binding protein